MATEPAPNPPTVYEQTIIDRFAWEKADAIVKNKAAADHLEWLKANAARIEANDVVRNRQIEDQVNALEASNAQIEAMQLERCVSMMFERYATADPWRKFSLIVSDARALQVEIRKALAVPLP